MDKVSGRLTVFFKEPFWIGIFERILEGNYLYVELHLVQDPKTMKYMISF